MTLSSRIYLPATAPQDWQRLLAEPELHWKAGRSAHALAHAWQTADGFPADVAAVNDAGPGHLRDLELLLGLPEHKVPLPGGQRASQTDLFVLARNPAGALVSIAVEGKVSESFGELVADWRREASPGKTQRLTYLCEMLGLEVDEVDGLRYQLLHRTASALIEARRFNAEHAVMLVHSFSPSGEGLNDCAAFANSLGAPLEANSIAAVPDFGDPTLSLGWVTSTPA